MRRFTNINLKYQDKTFIYLIEYNQLDSEFISGLKYQKNYKNINFFNNSQYKRIGNEWYYNDEYNDLYIDSYKMCNVRLYLPEYSINTYKNTLYMLSAITWINGNEICLGNFLLNRLDAFAIDKELTYDSNNYYEYIDLNILDPKDMIYSDNWSDFRKNICGDHISKNSELNNDGSSLVFTLYPVYMSDNKYMILDSADGGQNLVNIATAESDYLSLTSSIKQDEYGINLINNIKFNDVYNDDLSLYFKETYDIAYSNLSAIKYEMVIKDNDNVYKYKTKIFTEYIKKFKEFLSNKYQDDDYMDNISWISWIKSDKKNKITSTSYNLNSIGLTWDDWRDGLSLLSSVTFYDSDYQELLYIFSNEIIITKELFSYMVNQSDIMKIDLNKDTIKDMKLYDINAINKTVNKIIQIDKPEDSKSNIIQPIFFKVRDASNIIIHPKVTENICINLDEYKSKTDSFMIKIEDNVFKQIGSTAYGIIFKIIGPQLPNKAIKGIYYILDQNSELITTGKYTYEQ